MRRPSPHDLLAETARLAFHFHWPLDTLLDLEHADRRAYLEHADELAARYGVLVSEAGAAVAGGAGEAGPEAEAEAEPVIDFDSISDPRVRKLFRTYYGGPA
jgi:hypothetical protein